MLYSICIGLILIASVILILAIFGAESQERYGC